MYTFFTIAAILMWLGTIAFELNEKKDRAKLRRDVRHIIKQNQKERAEIKESILEDLKPKVEEMASRLFKRAKGMMERVTEAQCEVMGVKKLRIEKLKENGVPMKKVGRKEKIDW